MKKITRKRDWYCVGSSKFLTLEAAEAFIDEPVQLELSLDTVELLDEEDQSLDTEGESCPNE